MYQSPLLHLQRLAFVVGAILIIGIGGFFSISNVYAQSVATNTASNSVYMGYLNGSTQPFITTKNISKDEALSNCIVNHTSNPKAQIYCTFNGVEIYSFKPTTLVTPGISSNDEASTDAQIKTLTALLQQLIEIYKELLSKQRKNLETTINENRMSIPVINSASLIRVDNPPLVQLKDNRDYIFKPWETPMFRWDDSFNFDDSSRCFVTFKYSDKSLYKTYVNTPDSYNHIGFYAPVISEFGILKNINVDCESKNQTFEAFVGIDINSPLGKGLFVAKSDLLNKTVQGVSYNDALHMCYKFNFDAQSDTTCTWSDVSIAQIKTYGEGVQSLKSFFGDSSRR